MAEQKEGPTEQVPQGLCPIWKRPCHELYDESLKDPLKGCDWFTDVEGITQLGSKQTVKMCKLDAILNMLNVVVQLSAGRQGPAGGVLKGLFRQS